jgi:hypothetical protein
MNSKHYSLVNNSRPLTIYAFSITKSNAFRFSLIFNYGNEKQKFIRDLFGFLFSKVSSELQFVGQKSMEKSDFQSYLALEVHQ